MYSMYIYEAIDETYLFDLILYVPSTIFQLNRDGSSRVEPVLSYDKCVLLKDHNAVTPVRLKPAVSRSRVKHSTIEPLLRLRQPTKNLDKSMRIRTISQESSLLAHTESSGKLRLIYP